MLAGNESAWLAMLMGAALKSTVVLGAAWLLTFILRSRSAASRHLVWTATAAALLALPLLSISLPPLRIGTRTLGGVPNIMFSVTAFGKAASHAHPTPATSTSTAGATSTPWTPDVRLWLPRIWAAGTLIGFGQMFIAWWVMRRLRLICGPAEHSGLFFALAHMLGVHHRVELIEVPAGVMPMNFGISKPAVFLPEDASEWPEDRLRVVLLHELAHVKRGDVATNLLMRAALCLFWWNPLAWTAWRQSIKERERAADDLVLAAGEAATGYAAHFLEIARSMRTSTPVAWAAIAMARPSQLEGRLLAILDSRIRRSTTGAHAAVAAAVMAIVLVAPFAALRGQDKLDPATAPVVQAAIQAATDQNNHDITDYAAAAFVSSRKFDAAQKLLESSLSIRAKTQGQASSAYAVGLIKLGEVSEKRNNTADAVDFYTRAVALGDSADTAPGLVYLASRAWANKDSASAESYVRRALAVAPTGINAGRALTLRGELENANGQVFSAEKDFREAIAQEPAQSIEAAITMQHYATLLRTQNRSAEAQAMAAQARAASPSTTAYYSATATAAAPPGGVFRIGGGVSAPVLISKTEPSYSEEARAAKFQGTVVLYAQIDPDGRATNVRVIKSLGLGLDEKAIESVAKWKFQPGTRDGKPVTVEATLEVNFRLL